MTTQNQSGKSLLSLTLLCSAAISVFGQGTVNFSNLSTALSSPPDRLIRFGPEYSYLGIQNGAPATTNLYPGLVAQLFYGSSTVDMNSLIAVSTAPGTLRASTSASAGTWFDNGTRTLNGIRPGDTANLQVRVWDITKGTDFATAINNPSYWDGPYGNWIGYSLIFQYTITTDPTTPPSESYRNMNNFVGFTLFGIPEPGSLATLCLGAVLLMLGCRIFRQSNKIPKD